MKLSLTGWSRFYYVHRILNKPILRGHLRKAEDRAPVREAKFHVVKEGSNIEFHFYAAGLRLNGNYEGCLTLNKREIIEIAALFGVDASDASLTHDFSNTAVAENPSLRRSNCA